MTAPDRTRAERAIAFLVAQIRLDDWDEPGILAVLRRVSERTLADVAAAAIHCAVHRTDQRTPACIALDGEHWRALRPAKDAAPLPPYLSDERCPKHGHTLPCLTCQADQRGPAKPLAPWRDLIRPKETSHE